MSVPNTFASATSAIPLANLDADFAYYDAAFQIVGTAMEVNYTFRLEDPTDNTKKAEFVMSGITTGTTRQYTLPNATGTLATLANTSQTFTGSTVFAPSTNSGTVTIGGIPQTGTITLGRSTASQTVDIAVGATTAASTKTVNIGTTGVSTSTTNLNYGSAVTGALVTHTWNAGANNMRLDSSGNLGIGTTSPTSPLQVATSNSNAYGAFIASAIGTTNIGNGARAALVDNGVGGGLFGNWYYSGVSDKAAEAGYSPRIELRTSDGSIRFSSSTSVAANTTIAWSEKMRLDSAGNLGIGTTTPGAKLEITGGLDATYNSNILINSTTTTAKIGFNPSGISSGIGALSTGTLVFYGNGANTERARIDASGNLLVGTTTTSSITQGFYVSPGSGTLWDMGHATGTASGAFYGLFRYNGGVIGSITQAGTTGVLFNVTSDQRLKTNIQDAANASSLIDALQVRQYDWKADGSHQRYGFVAQELVTVAPEAVHQPANPEEMMAVDYSKLVPMLVKELQSLRARVAQLESK